MYSLGDARLQILFKHEQSQALSLLLSTQMLEAMLAFKATVT